MTEKDFFYFHEVAKCLNFTEAAKNLYISQPALSKQIARLEKELGFSLFLRTKQEVKLTPGGMVLLEEYGRLSSAYYGMLNRARMADEGKQGELHIGVQEGQYLDNDVIDVLQGFRKRYPQINIEIESFPQRQLLEMIYQDRIDLGFCLQFDPRSFDGLGHHRLKTMPSYIILSATHPLAVSGQLKCLSALNSMTLLVVGNELAGQGEQYTLENCHKCGISPRNVRTVPSYATLYLQLAMGEGFVMMNQNIWYENRNLRFFPLPDVADVTQIICWQSNCRNPAVPLFLQTVEYIRNH